MHHFVWITHSCYTIFHYFFISVFISNYSHASLWGPEPKLCCGKKKISLNFTDAPLLSHLRRQFGTADLFPWIFQGNNLFFLAVFLALPFLCIISLSSYALAINCVQYVANHPLLCTQRQPQKCPCKHAHVCMHTHNQSTPPLKHNAHSIEYPQQGVWGFGKRSKL